MGRPLGFEPLVVIPLSFIGSGSGVITPPDRQLIRRRIRQHRLSHLVIVLGGTFGLVNR
jgi:hypothetical protein